MVLAKKVRNALQCIVESEDDCGESGQWSVKENLALASAVTKTGKEHWPSISRLMQKFGPNRRKINKLWYSPKQCSKQYAKIIDDIGKKFPNTWDFDLPMREILVQQLTEERIKEAQKELRKELEKESALKELLNDLECGKLDDSVPEMWTQLKRNRDFVPFVCDLENSRKTEAIILKRQESESTEAMTSTSVDFDESNSIDMEAAQSLLRLGKPNGKRSRDREEDGNGFPSKLLKVELNNESCHSSDTEPAVYLNDMSMEEKFTCLKVDDYTEEFGNVVEELNNRVECEGLSFPSNCAWIKRYKSLLKSIMNDPNSHLFDSVALSKKDENYKKIVKRVINPDDIKYRLRSNLYSSPDEFEQDLLLMLCNAQVYYPERSASNKIVRNIYDMIVPLLQCLRGEDGRGICYSPEPVSQRTRRHDQVQ